MSERGSGAGAFLLGLAVGAVLGLLLAPGSGDQTRARLGSRLRTLRDLAGDRADELKALVAGDDETDGDDEGGGGGSEADSRTARRELERRLAEARERRRSRRAAGEDAPAA